MPAVVLFFVIFFGALGLHHWLWPDKPETPIERPAVSQVEESPQPRTVEEWYHKQDRLANR